MCVGETLVRQKSDRTSQTRTDLSVSEVEKKEHSIIVDSSHPVYKDNRKDPVWADIAAVFGGREMCGGES